MVGKYPSRSKTAIEQSMKHQNAWQVTEGMGISPEQKRSSRVGDGSRVFVYNHFNVWIGAPPREEKTVAHALREAGFRTGLVGKYHLSWRQADPHACSLTSTDYDDERKLIAESAGFDFVEALNTCNIQSSTKRGNRFSHNPEFTLHHAQRFVTGAIEDKVPWFLYMGLTLPHPPNARLALTKYSVGDTPSGPGSFKGQEQAMERRERWKQSVTKAADEAVTAAVAVTVNAMDDMVKSAREVGAATDQSFRAFQGIQEVLGQAGISADQTSRALRTLRTRMEEARCQC
jgi:arylsulfatase A-like enzyme